MAAPVASYAQAAIEGSSLGSYVRAQRRLIGANTVDAQAFSTLDAARVTGIYSFDSGTPQAITLAGHDGTSTGFLWIQNPVGNTKNARLRQLYIKVTALTTAATSHATAPFISLTRCAFTGTFSGASLTPAKIRTSHATPSCDVRTAVTGATVSLVGSAWAAMCSGIEPLTADVLNLAVVANWSPKSSDEYLIIAPGECLVVYQSTAGTASDLRVAQFSGVWDEVEV